ncbi:MAG: tRNA (adenosine(37)-N6)-threonylcarbamoyltransferase complex dimerization subunit type 1 TsaB [Candidatus Omnitrophica bacterium]|nr:tRNA (adenosine(37)-N6)-threonylcarbamoyltransferase complex dimerization subunit type 1 TsaB [Candidatus Omnitrophota bacterium]
MKILSIETTSELSGTAFLEDGEILSEYSFKTADAAGSLIRHIDTVLKDSHCRPVELDLITVSAGPGLWTGIRLGMGAAKGLAAAFKTRIYCVGAAESLFFAVKEFKMPAFCVVNAYRGKIHLSYFNGKFSYKGYTTKTVDAGEIHEMCRKKKVLLTGPGISILPEKTKKLKTVTIPAKKLLYPQAGTNALLAVEKIKRDVPSLPMNPYYGR